MKLTKHKLSIFALVLILFLSLTAFFGINSIKADASGPVTVSKSNVFTADNDYQVKSGAVGGENSDFYTTFTFRSNEDTVSYRRNLAYHWYTQKPAEGEGENKDEVIEGQEGLFNMEIGFSSVNFEKFTITFESQEYNKTKDGKSTNYIIFFPSDGKVNVIITTDKDEELDENTAYEELDAGALKIEFTKKIAGAYEVKVSDEK